MAQQTDDNVLAEEARAILENVEGTEPLEGMAADHKISILGAAFSTSRELVLGEKVELRVVGYVCEAGDKLIENEGKRPVRKVQTSLIEFMDGNQGEG